MGAIFAMAKNREKTLTHSPGFSLSAAPYFSSVQYHWRQVLTGNYMGRIVIKSRVNAWFIVLGLGYNSGLG
jgi:hypothetical protein